MKKTYKNPILTVVKIQPARIMAGSFLDGLGGEGVDGGASLGREASFDLGDDLDISDFDEELIVE